MTGVTMWPKCKWEYKEVVLSISKSNETQLNSLGKEGWELVAGVGANVVIFKRELPIETPAKPQIEHL